MKKTSTWLTAVVFLAGLPAIAVAAGPVDNDMARAGATVTRADVEAKVKERFQAADTNRDGFLTEAEVIARRDAMMAERRDAHFKAMDKDGNGAITRAEFDSANADRAGRDRRAMAGRGHKMRGHHGIGPMGGGFGMIRQADANADGKISLAEALAKPLARFDAADGDKDGSLSAQERHAARADRKSRRVESR